MQYSFHRVSLMYTRVPEIHRKRSRMSRIVSFCLKRQHNNALQVSLIKNSKLRRNRKGPLRVSCKVYLLAWCLLPASHVGVDLASCNPQKIPPSLYPLAFTRLCSDLACSVYRKAISPPARCLWCRKAWPPQKTRKTCALLASLRAFLAFASI